MSENTTEKPAKKSQIKRYSLIAGLLLLVLFIVFAIVRSLIIAIFINGQI